MMPPPPCRPRTRRALGPVAAALLLAAIATPARAETLVVSDFRGTAPGANTPWTATSTLAAGTGFSGWTRGTGLSGSAAVNDAFGLSACAGSTARSTLGEAIAAQSWVRVFVGPTTGTLDLSAARIDLAWRHLSGFAPNRVSVFTSAAGFAAGQQVWDSPEVPTTLVDRAAALHLPVAGHGALAAPLEIRFVFWDALYCGHAFEITAFALANGVRYPLALSASGSGTASVSPDLVDHAPESIVRLAATPAAGAAFVGWSGDAAGTRNPRDVVMDRARTVVAHFAPVPAGRGGDDVVDASFAGASPALSQPWYGLDWLAAGVEWRGATSGPGIARQPCADAFCFSVDAGSSGTPSTFGEAIRDGEYLAFVVAPQPGAAPLDLRGHKVHFAIDRISGHSPSRFALVSSVGGFAEGAALLTTPSSGVGTGRSDWDAILPPVAEWSALSGPVEFRLYGFGARYTGHQAALVDVAILGTRGLVTLEVSSSGPGRVEAVPQGPLLEQGAAVTLLPIADAGARFLGWSGTRSGPGSPLRLVADGDVSIVGRFGVRPAPAMAIGMNVGAVVDWSDDWFFVDSLRTMRAWLTRDAAPGGPWQTDFRDRVPLDARGWPTALPFDPGDGAPPQVVHTVGRMEHAGTHRLRWSGRGRFDFAWNTSPTTRAVRHVVATGGEQSAEIENVVPFATFYLEMFETDPGDPVRVLGLESPDFAPDLPTRPFHPLYVERLAPFAALRMMDWGRTNGSPVSGWAQRTTPDHYTQSRDEGASLEEAARMANLSGQDLWLCVPHRADDDWVENAARLVDAALDPHLAIYLEYSNETWNVLFSQTTWVQDRGEERGLSADRWRAGQMYAGLRSAEVWHGFAAALRPGRRLVKVLASQSVSTSITQARLDALLDPAWNPAGTLPDAIAIAPYFTHNFTTAEVAAGLPVVDELVATDMPASIEAARAGVRAHRALADAQGMRLVAYEGGQHYVGVYGAENDDALTAILLAANRDPRMYDRYLEYLDMLRDEGIDLLMNFSMTGRYSKYGSWGVIERQDQPLADAPKLRALLDWQAAHPVPWTGTTPGDADGDGIDDAVDVCPAAADPLQGDADGDGSGDACDACTDPVAGRALKPALGFSRLRDGRLALSLKLRARLPAGAVLDPAAEGVSIGIADAARAFAWSVDVPPGSDPATGVGWSTRRAGSQWRWTDAAGSSVGVTRLDLKARRLAGGDVEVALSLSARTAPAGPALPRAPWSAVLGFGPAGVRRDVCDEAVLAACRGSMEGSLRCR